MAAVKNHSSPSILRPEARPFRYEGLYTSQREAFEKIIRAMASATKAIDHRGMQVAPTIMPNIEQDRTNRTVFLSGERGTGKSSVLLTVQYYLSDRQLREESNTLPKSAGDDLHTLIDAPVLWLEPLDLDPLPGPTNLLAAILTRIDRAISLGQDTGCSPGVLNPFPDAENAQVKLQQLKCDVSMAWDGNLDQRAGQLDPDAYAQEVMRAENARLMINSRLCEVLDALAKQVPWVSARQSSNGGALFVLPIDDMDLNPTRCLDLLRLIRLISVPRLFVIALGSVEAMANVAWAEAAGTLAQIGKNGLSRTVFDQLEVHAYGHEVAVETLRKSLPPEQRVHLEHRTADEALAFCLPGNERNLRDLMDLCKLQPAPQRRSPEPTRSHRCYNDRCGHPHDWIKDLTHLLMGRAIPRQSATRPETDFFTQPNAGFQSLLVCSTRELADLWLEVQGLAGNVAADNTRQSPEKTIQSLAVHAAKALRDGILNDPGLSGDDRLRVSQGIEVRSDGTIQFDASIVTVQAQAPFYDTIGGQFAESGSVQILPAMYLNRHERWSMRPRDRSAPEWDPNSLRAPRRAWYLSDRTGAWFRLLYDLSVMNDRPWLVGGQRTPLHETADYVVVTWHLAQRMMLHVPWIIPPLGTFWAMDRFLDAWNAVIDYHRDKQKTDDEHSREWIACNWLEASARALMGEPEVQAGATAGFLPEWSLKVEGTEARGQVATTLSRLLEGARSNIRGKYWAHRQFLRNVIVLLAPESGLPNESAEEIFEQVKCMHSPKKDECTWTTLEDFAQANAFLVRRLRGWLTRPAWTGEDVEVIAAIVNPRLFEQQVSDVLDQVRSLASVKDLSAMPDPLSSAEEFTRFGDDLMKARRAIVVQAKTARRRRMDRCLRAIIDSLTFYRCFKNHKLNTACGGRLCPEWNDVPESPHEEGLWPWVAPQFAGPHRLAATAAEQTPRGQ